MNILIGTELKEEYPRCIEIVTEEEWEALEKAGRLRDYTVINGEKYVIEGIWRKDEILNRKPTGEEDYMESKETRFGELFIEWNGKLTNIKDLPQYEYERFLKKMRALQIAYTVLKERWDDE